MPELPDVETFRRQLARGALHRKIARVEVKATRMLLGVSAAGLRRRLGGASLRRTERYGKYLFARIDGGGWLLLHFGMTGSLAYVDKGAPAPRYTRLLTRFGDGRALACLSRRRLGRIGLVDSPDDFVREKGLGPDALAPGVGLKRFRKMLADRRGSVKAALMDQGFIAGIGNVYSDEMLFQSRIDPRAPASRLGRATTAALHRAIGTVLRTAIRHRADPARMPQSWLLPHRDTKETCPRCGGTPRRLAIAGRHAYFCPRCQTRRR